MLLLLVGLDAIVLFFHLPVAGFVVSAILAVVLIMWPLDAFTVRAGTAGEMERMVARL